MHLLVNIYSKSFQLFVSFCCKIKRNNDWTQSLPTDKFKYYCRSLKSWAINVHIRAMIHYFIYWEAFRHVVKQKMLYSESTTKFL